MKPLHLVTIAIFTVSISACSIFKKPAVEAQQTRVITDRKWKLVELAGKPVADKINGKEPFLLLHTTDNRYSASGGCNGIGGNFSLEANGRIRFSAGMSTKMACENMEVENDLTKALMAADNYSIDGDNLSLNKARMAPLARFKAEK
jgi:heat shock protein HslJ